MEKIPDQDFITDDTVITKTDGKSLKYWQLRNDLIKYFKKNTEEFLHSDKYRDTLEYMLVMLLGREKIIPEGGQIKGKYKAIFDKLLEDFGDPGNFLLEKRDLPLFKNFQEKDTRTDV